MRTILKPAQTKISRTSWKRTTRQSLLVALSVLVAGGALMVPQAGLASPQSDAEAFAASLQASGDTILSIGPVSGCANRWEVKYTRCSCGDKTIPASLVADNPGATCSSVETATFGQSRVSNQTFNYTHDAAEWQPKPTASGCSSCGGAAPAKTGVPAMGLQRTHRFRSEYEAGSFGVGGFATYTDKRVTFVQTGGGVQVTVFDPNSEAMLRLYDGLNGDTLDGVYHDTDAISVKEAHLLDANGNLTTNLASARWFDVISHTGQVSRFEVITTATTATSATTPNDPSLLGRWNFDDVTATSTGTSDATGNAAHAGTFPAPPSFVAGRSGQTGDYALNFNGTNQGVKIGNPADLNFQGQITMSAWIKPTSTSGWHTILGHGYTTSPQAQCAMEIYNNTLYVGAWPGARPVATLPANATTTWTHVVTTYDGANWTVYINGTPSGTVADATGARTVNANWNIGYSDVPGDRRFFAGAIDDVRIYNRPLSAAEVTAMYGGTDPANTGLLAQWGMNEGQGATVADISGSTSAATHTGTLTPSIPTLVAGRTGQTGDTALHFDGNGWVNLGNAADLNLSGKITMTAWVKPDSLNASGYNNVLSHGFTATWFGGQNAYDYLMFQNGNAYGGSWNGTVFWAGATPPSNITSQWTHMAAEYDGNNWRLYLNGTYAGITNSGTGAIPVNANWVIGASTQIADLRSFVGSIDDVRIYNRALSDAEIYNLGANQNSYGGRLISIKDVKGYGLNVAYKYNPATNAQDATATQTDPDLLWEMNTSSDDQGDTVTYTYGTQPVAGNYVISQASFSNGQSATYEYADGLHLTKVSHSAGPTSTFTYTVSGNTTKVAITDTTAEAGHEKKTAYLSNQVTILGGTAQSAQVWNQSALMCRLIQNGAGEVSYMNFTDTARNGLGNVTTVYEGGNRIKQMNAEVSEQFFLDGASMVTANGSATVQGAGEPWYASVGWDTPARLKGTFPSMYKPDGTYNTYAYDASTFPTQKAYTDGSSEFWQYDANHNVTKHTDRAGRVEVMTYDAHNNLLTKTVGTGADAGTTTYAYYPAGDVNQYLLKTETDANGNATDYTYDANHHVLTKTLPADVAGGTRPVYAYQYDSSGRLSQSTDPVGRFVKYTYDGMDRVVDRNYCDVSHEATVYGTGDNANRVIAQSDRDGNWTAIRYDGTGRVVRTIGGISNQADATNLNFAPDTAYHTVTDTTYLPGSGLVATATRNGEKTVYAYDYRNREIARTVYSGQQDASGNPIGLTTTSTYVQNSLFCTTDPFGRKTYYDYRVSDMQLARKVTETSPGGAGAIGQGASLSGTVFPAVSALARSSITANAPYLVEDYTYDADGLKTQVADSRGLVSTTTYDTRGRATVEQAAVGSQVQARRQTVYDAVGNRIEEDDARYFDSADAGGYTKSKTVTTYTGRNLPASRTEAPGQTEVGTTTFTYYLDGKQATVTDPNQSAIAAQGGTAAPAILMVRPLCGWALGSIDQAGHGTITDTSIGGDQIHIIQVKDLKSLTTTTSSGLVIPNFLNEVSMDVPDANTITESTTQYDTRHRPIASTTWSGPLGAVYRNDVPAYWNGQVKGGTNAQAAVPSGVTGQTTLYYYGEDLSASQPTLTHAFGPSINLQPLMQALNNAGVNVLIANITNASARATVSPAGEISASIQDGLGRTVIQARLDKTTYAPITWNVVINDQMDSGSNLLMTTAKTALGNTRTAYTDGAGRTRKVVDPKGQVSTATYDNDGNVLSTRDPNGVGQDYTYDEQNRRIACTDTFGTTTTTKYSLGGLVLNQQDGKSVWNIKDATYDARGRMLTKTTRLDGTDTTAFTYDANSNRLTITDGEGKQTTYAYDIRNLKTSWTFPGQTSTTVGAPGYDTVTYQYDAAARVSKFIRQTGQSEVNTWAFNGTLTQKQFQDALGNPTDHDDFQYDQNNRLVQATKGRYNNTVQMTYDQIGRKASETLLLGTPGNSTASYATQYGYDADNRNTSVTYPDGQVVAKNYDQRNQVTGVSLSNQNVATFAYDAGGRETSRILGNGVEQDRTYRTDNLLNAITVSRGGVTDASLGEGFGYDNNKNLTQETYQGLVANFSTTLAQDAKDRLTQFSRTNGDTQNWTLTKEGDWSQTTGSTSGTAINQTRTHNDKHQITAIAGTTVAAPTYDAQGDLTTDEQGRVYVWDQEKQLQGVMGGTTNEGYTYDALGRRVTVTTSGSTKIFVSAGSQEVEEYQGATLTKTYVYGNGYVDDVVLEVQGTTPLYHLGDRRYSTMALLDSSGNVAERYAYSPYGQVTVLDAGGAVKSSPAMTNILWTGRRLDSTGNYYFRSRYFDVALGRFISRDVDYLDGENLYEGYFAEDAGLDPMGFDSSDTSANSEMELTSKIAVELDSMYRNVGQEVTENNAIGNDPCDHKILKNTLFALSLNVNSKLLYQSVKTGWDIGGKSLAALHPALRLYAIATSFGLDYGKSGGTEGLLDASVNAISGELEGAGDKIAVGTLEKLGLPKNWTGLGYKAVKSKLKSYLKEKYKGTAYLDYTTTNTDVDTRCPAVRNCLNDYTWINVHMDATGLRVNVAGEFCCDNQCYSTTVNISKDRLDKWHIRLLKNKIGGKCN